MEWGLGEWGVGHVLYRPSTSALFEYFTIAMSSSVFLHFKTLLKGVKLFFVSSTETQCVLNIPIFPF